MTKGILIGLCCLLGLVIILPIGPETITTSAAWAGTTLPAFKVSTVAERIEKDWGQNTLLLFEGMVSETVGIGQEVLALWSVWWHDGELIVWRNGEALFNWQSRDEGWRLSFVGETAVKTDGEETIFAAVEGAVTVGYRSDLLLDLGNQRFRLFFREGDSAEAVAAGKCNCFGIGAETKGCLTKDCDEGVSCGSKRTCRWSAGTVPQ